jgi:hypothetical protein
MDCPVGVHCTPKNVPPLSCIIRLGYSDVREPWFLGAEDVVSGVSFQKRVRCGVAC